jgi:hypothetical protein
MYRLSLIIVLALFFSVFSQCLDNSECKGGRLCVNGVCTDRETIQQSAPPAQERTIPASGSSATDVSNQLPTDAGNIAVSAEPLSAVVALDGENKGNVPQLLKQIPAGKHVLQVTANNFAGVCDTIDVLAGGSDTLTYKLKALAALSITTKPMQAGITINDTEFGKTPFSQTGLLPGQYDVLLRKEKFADTAFTVMLSYDQRVSLSIVLRHADQLVKAHKRKKLTFMGIAGAAALGAGIGGFLCDRTVSNRYDEYRAINEWGDHSAQFDRIKGPAKIRNVLYGVSIGLGAIVGISLFF